MRRYCFYATLIFGPHVQTRVSNQGAWRDGRDFTALVDALLPAVVEAGRIQMTLFRRGIEVTTKTDATPVTDADQRSEAILTAALKAIAPDLAVVAEEAVAAGEIPTPGRVFFLVDPLDGTREFISNSGEFTINIALVIDARPAFGLIYAPALKELFVTLSPVRAVTATLDPMATPSSLAALAPRDIRARVADMSRLTAAVSRSHMNDATRAYLARLSVVATATSGSSLKFCRIATGAADVYPRAGQTCEWDIAAGHAILAAAGGTLTDLEGHPLVYGRAAARFRNPDYVAWGRRSA